MHVISVISTKGGVGKTTTAANLGGFIADAGLRVLLIDLDMQPTLSSYYQLIQRAPGGIYELLAFNERDLSKIISRTTINNLDVILSNDEHRQLGTLLLHAADGRLRLHNLISIFASHYDLVLIDTQGARSVMLEMAILASHVALSPITPETLAARELWRGTIQLIEDMKPYKQLGITPPVLNLLINRVPAISSNARLIEKTLQEIFYEHEIVRVLQTRIPAIETFPRAATQSVPVHRLEYRRPTGRVAPSALEIMRNLAIELCPQWLEQFTRIAGRIDKGQSYVKHP